MTDKKRKRAQRCTTGSLLSVVSRLPGLACRSRECATALAVHERRFFCAKDTATGIHFTFRERRERFANKQQRTDPATDAAATETLRQIARKPRRCAGHKAASLGPPEPALSSTLHNFFVRSTSRRFRYWRFDRGPRQAGARGRSYRRRLSIGFARTRKRDASCRPNVPA